MFRNDTNSLFVDNSAPCRVSVSQYYYGVTRQAQHSVFWVAQVAPSARALAPAIPVVNAKKGRPTLLDELAHGGGERANFSVKVFHHREDARRRLPWQGSRAESVHHCTSLRVLVAASNSLYAPSQIDQG